MTRVDLRHLETPIPGGVGTALLSRPVAHGLTLPLALQAEISGTGGGISYTLVLLLDSDEVRYRVNVLELNASNGLSAQDVRETALPRLLHTLAAGDPLGIMVTNARADREKLRTVVDQNGLPVWRRRAQAEAGRPGPSDETVQWVARVYTWFAAVGGRPAKGVEETLDIPPRTASRWIALAKDRGLMEGVVDGPAANAAE